jgi:hypothetical protein
VQNEDKEQLEQIQKDIADIQKEIHACLQEEDKEVVSSSQQSCCF